MLSSFCVTPLAHRRHRETFSSTFPSQTEDNTQFVASTDAAHGTVTNGTWASPSPPATPVSSANECGPPRSHSAVAAQHPQCLSRWMNMSAHLSSPPPAPPAPSVLFYLLFISLANLSFSKRLFLPLPLRLDARSRPLLPPQANSRMEPWRTIRTKVRSQIVAAAAWLWVATTGSPWFQFENVLS